MKFLMFALLVSSFPVIAQNSHEEHSVQSVAKRKAIDVKDQKEVLEVLNKNDVLFNAFLKKDAALIEKSSKELQILLSKSQSTLLKEVKGLSQKLLSVKAKNDNQVNLQSYESVLNPLIKVVQQYDVGGKFNVFSCPMVKKSWIQNLDTNKDVKNVYAMDMLECGSQDTHF